MYLIFFLLFVSTVFSVNKTCGITTSVVCHPPKTGEYSWTKRNNFLFVKSNGLPQYTLYDYCPFGLGGLFCGKYKSCPSGVFGEAGELCIPEGSGLTEKDLNWQNDESDWCTIATDVDDTCPAKDWETTTCPADGGSKLDRLDCAKSQTTLFGLPANPLPVRKAVGPTSANGQFIGMGLDGVPLFDSFEAGGSTLTGAHIIQDDCNAHTTPGMTGEQYHYHRVPHCIPSTVSNEFPFEPMSDIPNKGEPTPYEEEPGVHSPRLGLSMDGFNLYGYIEGGTGKECSVSCSGTDCEDTCMGKSEECMCKLGYWTGDAFCRDGNSGVCAIKPNTDACHGHFGETPDSNGKIVYHYHSSRTTPYSMGCFGPSWGKCKGNRCGDECPSANEIDGVCVATPYLMKFNFTEVEFGDGIGNCKRCGCLKGCNGGAPKAKDLHAEVKEVLDLYGMAPDAHLWNLKKEE